MILRFLPRGETPPRGRELASAEVAQPPISGRSANSDGSAVNLSLPLFATLLAAHHGAQAVPSYEFIVDNRADGAGPETWGSNLPIAVAGVSNALQLAAGASHTCARKGDGTVWCWGSNAQGQIGFSDGSVAIIPLQVPGIEDSVAIAAGARHTCSIDTAGELSCWGSNDKRQITAADTEAYLLPEVVPGLPAMAAVAAGLKHTCG